MESNYILIESLKDAKGTKSSGGATKFEAQVNPASIKIGHSISYKGDEKDTGSKKATGDAAPQVKFTGVNPQTVSFELILDGTGALRRRVDDGEYTTDDRTVTKMIEEFKETCYFFKGEIHEPPYVKISWGGKNLLEYNKQGYYARIKTFDITYLMFTPQGAPLRAKINASFTGSMDKMTETKVKDEQSPDLSHVISVRAGDTLPLLCEKIYGKRQMFHEVARVNNLISFRHIEPGMELVFPPIK